MPDLHKNLKSLRRERKIDLEAIEKRTKIDIKYLKAIENGEFEVLPTTYIRLFLKAYCVEIGADPIDALHQLDELSNKGGKTFNSHKEVLKEDKDIVEDLILVAVNEAITNISKKIEDKMNSATGGMLGGGFPGI